MAIPVESEIARAETHCLWEHAHAAQSLYDLALDGKVEWREEGEHAVAGLRFKSSPVVRVGGIDLVTFADLAPTFGNEVCSEGMQDFVGACLAGGQIEYQFNDGQLCLVITSGKRGERGVRLLVGKMPWSEGAITQGAVGNEKFTLAQKAVVAALMFLPEDQFGIVGERGLLVQSGSGESGSIVMAMPLCFVPLKYRRDINADLTDWVCVSVGPEFGDQEKSRELAGVMAKKGHEFRGFLT